MWVYILIGIVIIVLVYSIVTFNNLAKLNNKVKEAFATMDVYLKKRWELVPNIVATVKGYTKYENDTLKEIVNLRNNNYDDMNQKKKIDENEILDSSIPKLFILVENYPELKSNKNYLDLSNQLVKIENDIANARKYYNAVVRNFNNKVEMFPSNIFSKIFGYKKIAMYNAEDIERQNVEVNMQ